MREISRVLMLILLAISITSCSVNAPSSQPSISESAAVSPPPSSPEKPAEKEAKPQEKTTIKMAISSEPDSLDPMFSAATDTQSTILLNVFEGLLSFDEKGNFLPGLAQRYELSLDGLTYSFWLKENIRFHNGQAFSAKDVKYTYDALAGLGGEPPLDQTISQLVKSVETDGDYYVEITLFERNAGFITKAIVPICPEGYDNAAEHPIGTGPYKFVEYLPGQKVILEKYEDYHTTAERMPSIDKVEVRIMTDANARLMALKSGDLDLSFISAKDIPSFADDFNIVQSPSNTVQVMGLNNTAEPLNDVRVRQAINYAINKEEIINGAYSGSGTRVDSFLSPVMESYYNFDMKVYDTDIDKAKELLSEAGLTNGFTLTVTVPANYQVHIDTAQIIKNQLAKVGIDVQIELVEWAGWLENVYNNAEYQATIIGHTGKLDPNDFLNRFDSHYARNYFKYSSSEYDKLIAEAAVCTNEAERAEIYKKCQQMLVDEAASVFIHDPSSVYAVRKNLEGFKTYPISFYDFASLRVR